jgi:type II secretory pathway pseudopilin PulG
MRRCRSNSRPGWGLIEVVAALAILAGAAAMLFDAQVRSLDQVHHAQDMRRARQLAEDLIEQWQQKGWPRSMVDSGTCAEETAWRWKFTAQKILPLEMNRRIEMIQVHLEIERTTTRDVRQGPETVLSLTWLVPSLEKARQDGPATQNSLHAR